MYGLGYEAISQANFCGLRMWTGSQNMASPSNWVAVTGSGGFPKLGMFLESYTNEYHNMESMLFLVVPIQVQLPLKGFPVALAVCKGSVY